MSDSLIGVVLGSALVLLGTLVGPYFQRRHEKWRAVREDQALLRSKAQEIFNEIDFVVEKSREASIDALQRLMQLSNSNGGSAKAVADLGKLRGLVAIYYPTGLDYIDAFEENSATLINNIKSKINEAIQRGEQGAAELVKLPTLMAVSHQRVVDVFADELRKHIIEQVKKISPVSVI